MTASDAATIREGRIGLLGGTFDPIHLGHLLVAELVADSLALERVVFIPNNVPPHDKPELPAAPEHRLAMLELAIADNPGFEVSREEIERPGASYSIDTIREFRRRLGPEAELYFIVGADELLALAGWREPDAILAKSRVVGVARPGSDLSHLAGALGQQRADLIQIIDTPVVDISSSEIRRRVAVGLSIRYMTPDVVVEYIYANGLYAPGSGEGAPQ